MRTSMDRREFIKLISLMPLLAPGLRVLSTSPQKNRVDERFPNILILVFDTLSAKHVSLHGYPRMTTPSLERFAERATVFHSHYSSGNFTTPSTASLFTGTYPWTNRAFSHQATIAEEYAARTIFREFSEMAYTVGFSQNLLVNIMLYDLIDSLDEFTLPNDISLVDYNLLEDVFFKDYIVAQRAERVYLKKPGEMSNSLFLAPLFWALKTFHKGRVENGFSRQYPLGLPGYHDMLYPLEGTMDWIVERARSWTNPFLAYLHFMPPHDPYLPSGEFATSFYDEWNPPPKPPHFYSEGHSDESLQEKRRRYDQYIAYVDAQFDQLYNNLQKHGVLDNTWLILTSDHGELFERGIHQHTTRTLFEPVIRVPLLISAPGQSERTDVYTSTSCVDLLPTLMQVTNQSIPEWIEGEVLPPFRTKSSVEERSIYVVEAKSNPKFELLNKATLAIRKGPYKLVYYMGYEGFDGEVELFDVENDPEELNNLKDSHKSQAADLTNELLEKVEEANQPYIG